MLAFSANHHSSVYFPTDRYLQKTMQARKDFRLSAGLLAFVIAGFNLGMCWLSDTDTAESCGSYGLCAYRGKHGIASDRYAV